jgi:hypothetical protein
MFTNKISFHDTLGLMRGVSLLAPDPWTERRLAVGTVSKWLRSQERDGYLERLPQYAFCFLEALVSELTEQFRWEESVPFPRLRSLLDGQFIPHVDALVEAHADFRERLQLLKEAARKAPGALPSSFGPHLRRFLDDLDRHQDHEERLWNLLRPSEVPREWPDGQDPTKNHSGAFA